MQSRWLFQTVAVLFATFFPLAELCCGQFDEVAVAQDEDDSEFAKPDDLLLQLDSAGARGGSDRAEAIAAFARLGKWEQVDRWLTAVDQVNNSDELVQTAKIIGNGLLLRISLRSELSDASQSALGKMKKATKSATEDPALLAAAIERLTSESPDDLLSASRTLLAGGDASIQAIAEGLGKGIRSAQRKRAIDTLRNMGDGGSQALGQLALYGADSVRPFALSALESLDPETARDFLVSAAFARDANESELSLGQSAMSRMSSSEPFDRVDAIAYLLARLQAHHSVASQTPNSRLSGSVWAIDESRKSVSSTRSQQIFLAYRNLYDAAQRLLRVGPLPPSALRSAIKADLAYRVMVDNDWGDTEQIDAFYQTFNRDDVESALSECLNEALDNRDVPATLGTLRLIAATLQDKSSQSKSIAGLLQSSGGQMPAIVSAARSAFPRIRYEAAMIIHDAMELHGLPPSFAGSSYVRKTIAEMARLSDRPVAILIETRPAITLRQTTLLGQLGFSVRSVQSVFDAEQEIANGGDLRMVVSKIRLSDLQPAELVDRVRRQSNGSNVPIVFFNDNDAPEKSVRAVEIETASGRWGGGNQPAVYLVDLPGDISAYRPALFEMAAKRRLEPLTVSDRAGYRSFATDKLP